MRHSIKRISKSALSVILALMMVVSTMAVGMVTVGAASSEFTAKQDLYIDIGDQWQKLYDNGTSIPYVRFSYNNNDNDNYNNCLSRVKLDNSNKVTGSIYKVSVPNNNYCRAILLERCDPKNTETSASSKAWNNVSTTASARNSDSDNLFTISGYNTTEGWSEFSSSGGGTTLGTAPIDVLNGTNVMFYIKAYYSDKDLGLSTSTKSSKKATKIGSSNEYAYISIAKTDLESYYYISNNLNNWEGKPNIDIKNAEGGELFVGNDNVSKTSATTGLTTLSSASANLGSTTPITLTTVSDKTTPAYGSNLYVQYYVDKNLVNTDADLAASTSGATYDLDVSGYSAGEHKIQTVLTDGNVYYISDTDTFTVSSATTYTISASAYDSSKGTVTVNDSQLNPSTSVTTTNTTFNISVTPNTGYTLSSLTIGDNEISLTDDEKSKGYSNASYSISGNLTITPVFSAISSSTNYYVAGSKELTGKNWEPAGTQMTETPAGSGIFTATFSNVSTNANTNMFKITTGKWGTNGTDEFNSDYLNTSDSATAAICSSYGNDNNILITLNAQSDVTITFNSNTKKITVSAGSNKTQLAPPKISAPESIGADEVSVTLTVADMSYPPEAGTITYVLYKNGEESDSSTDRTFSISQEGTYEVKAVPASSSNYIASELSASITIKKLSAESYNLYIKDDNKAYPMVKNSSGIYISEKTVADSSDLFYIEDVANSKYSDSGAGSNSWYINSVGENSGGKVSAWSATAPTNGVDMYSNHTGSEKYVAYNPTTQKVFLVSGGSSADSAYVFAKNGTIGGTASFGTTVAEAANTSSTVTYSSSDTDYKKYTAKVGSSVKVTTTMAAAVNSERYVHAFVVNGKTYLATEGRADSQNNKTYYAQFVIEEDVTNYEVTPVYYVNDCKTEGNYVTFYVNASELDGKTYNWGNTIASYAYYYKGNVEADGVLMSDGTYPGQPLLFDEGQNSYYCRVPKTMSDGTGSYSVTGMTINNYYNDSLHRSISSLTAHEQSYDYNDFKLISEFGYDIIRFDMKPRNTANNKTKIGLSDDSKLSTDSPADNHTIKIADFTNTTANGWEYFVDNNNNKVDAVGNKVDASQTKKLYIVSTARYDYSGVGIRSTKWFIYAANSADATTATLVASGLPSDFIPRANPEYNTNSYNIINNKYAGAETMITFEQIKDIESAKRMDGRWYYAKTTQNVTVKAGYVLGDSTTINVNADYVNINGTETEVEIKNGSEVSLTASPLAGYTFVGWMTYDATNNKFVSLSSTLGSSFTTQLNSDVYYVAKYIEAVNGSLIISHSAYNGSDKKGGLGYYYVKADLYGQDGSLKSSQIGTGTGNNGQSISFTNLDSSDTKIVITISTETAGENTFRYWYTTSSNGYEIIEDLDGDMTWNGTATSDPTGKSGTLTYTFETEVWKLFNADYSKQVVTQMNFYSDIAPMSKNYKLTYKYTDRFGKEKIYVVKGTHDDAYYVKNNNSWAPSDELITKNAPPIDDLYKNCTWIIANSNKDGTDATLVAVQNGKTYKVDIYNASGASESYTLPINSYVKNSAGEFFVADEYIMDGETKKYFSYWAVYKRVVKDGKVTRGEEVARHFYREYTLVVLDDYWIEPVYGAERNDQVYISAPQYTREKYSNEDGTVVKDSLYVDFMVAYMSAAGDLIRNDVSGDKYQTGLIIEIGQNKVLGTNEDSSVNTDYSGITYDSNLDTVKSAANNLTGSPTKYSFATGDNRKLYNFRATNTNYNNMNRLDYAVPFNNTDKNLMYVMKAYYYVIIDGEIVLSNPVYFNLYEIGTSDPITE